MSGGSYETAAPPERVVAQVRRHARVLILPAVVLIALAGAVGYLGFGGPLDADKRGIVWITAAAVFLLAVVWPFVHWASRRSTITTRRIIVRSGFVARVRTELPLERAVDVAVRRSWLQFVFGSGDVRIGGDERPLVLVDVPRPALIQSAVLVLLAQEAREGLRSTR